MKPNSNPYPPIKINGGNIDLSTPNKNIPVKGLTREKRMRVRDAYVNYNQDLTPLGWEQKKMSIPLAPQNIERHPFNNSIAYKPDVRGSHSPDTSGNRRSCNLIRQNFGIECKDDYDVLDQCQIDDPDKILKRKHNKFMKCRNARSEFQNSNCRAGDMPAPGKAEREFMNPGDSGHIERIYNEARYAKKCVKAYIMKRINQIFTVFEEQFNIANTSQISSNKTRMYIEGILYKFNILFRNEEEEELKQAIQALKQELTDVIMRCQLINKTFFKITQDFYKAKAIKDRAVDLLNDNNVPENDIIDTDTDTNINAQLQAISRIQINAAQIVADAQNIEESRERVAAIYEELRIDFSHFFKFSKSAKKVKKSAKKTKKSAKKSAKKTKKSAKKTKKSAKKTKKSVRNNKK
jgi:hypothetical protein